MKISNDLKVVCEAQKDIFLSEYSKYIEMFMERGLRLKFSFHFTDRFYIPYSNKKKMLKTLYLRVGAIILPSQNKSNDTTKNMFFSGTILKITKRNGEYKIKKITNKSFNKLLDKLMKRLDKRGADNFFRGRVNTLLLKVIMPYRYANITKDIAGYLPIMELILFIIFSLFMLIIGIVNDPSERSLPWLWN